MLHRDVNENKVFDFVFVDPPHVLDRAVFEGNKMIALVFQAP
jgi:16S rRNA G966 N2-methylase RsmD